LSGLISGHRPRHCPGDIEMKNVSTPRVVSIIFTLLTLSSIVCVSYSSKPISLCDATIFFPTGETTFVVGKSGSGKRTLGQLSYDSMSHQKAKYASTDIPYTLSISTGFEKTLRSWNNTVYFLMTQYSRNCHSKTEIRKRDSERSQRSYPICSGFSK